MFPFPCDSHRRDEEGGPIFPIPMHVHLQFQVKTNAIEEEITMSYMLRLQ